MVAAEEQVGPGSRMHCAFPVLFLLLNLSSLSLLRISYHVCAYHVWRVRLTAPANLMPAAVPLNYAMEGTPGHRAIALSFMDWFGGPSLSIIHIGITVG